MTERTLDKRVMEEGWQPVEGCPGIYRDRQGSLHFSVVELLDVFGVADTPGNREVLIEQARQVIAEIVPSAAVEVRE